MKQAEMATRAKSENGVILCPKCGRPTNLKTYKGVYHSTMIIHLIMVCPECKEESLFDYPIEDLL